MRHGRLFLIIKKAISENLLGETGSDPQHSESFEKIAISLSGNRDSPNISGVLIATASVIHFVIAINQLHFLLEMTFVS